MKNKGCVFCHSSSKMSREHVLPNWLCDLYPNETMITNQFVGKSQKTWPSKIFQHKAKVVCEPCNNGWMSKLEGEAKPILTKLMRLSTTIIDQNEQAILSFWAQKTLLMLNQAVPGDLKITSDLYDDLYTKKSASPKVLVQMGWRMLNRGTKDEPIASFELKQIPSVDVPSDLLEAVTKQKDSGGFIWKAVFAIGPVVFEMAGHNMQITLTVDTNSKVVATIRPYTRDLQWPLEWPIEAEGGLSEIKKRL